MNILKALEGLTAKPDEQNTQNSAEAPPENARPVPQPEKVSTAEDAAAPPNVMISVLERHERISNRIRSAKK